VKRSTLILLVLLASCNAKDKYSPATYLNETEQKDALSGIVTYIFSAPPYVSMKDRFKPEYKSYYDSMSQRLFSLDRFYVETNKRRYYLVMRPGTTDNHKRAAGGYYDVDATNNFGNFRETFVTPLLPDSVARERGRFLFDQMVKHDLEKYLKMQTYVQWPNPISYYDSTIYEWKMDLNLQPDSVERDTTSVN
jgi:hypothetical protein